MPFALFVLAACVAAIAVLSMRYQVRTWRRLRTETLASDDRRYLRGLCQRRTLNAVLMMALAGMLAGSVLSGGLDEFGRLAQVKQPDMTDADRDALRTQLYYWTAILGLLFFVLAIAMADYSPSAFMVGNNFAEFNTSNTICSNATWPSIGSKSSTIGCENCSKFAEGDSTGIGGMRLPPVQWLYLTR